MIRVILAIVVLVAAGSARANIDIQEVETPGGLNAWLVEDHSIPFVALELRFRGGAALDDPDKRGATNLMVALLEEGAGDMDAREFSRATKDLAASFEYRMQRDAVAVSARFLTENRDRAVELLRESLIDPRFDPDSIERVRAQVRSSIESSRTEPRDMAEQAFGELVFGDHPYASSENGTLDSVAALTRDDLADAHKAALARDRLHISAAGDITAEELAALLDRLLGDLPGTGGPLPGDAEVDLAGGIKVVEFDTPQSVATFAQPGLERDDPDFFAAYVLNHILGGGSFESRLMNEVREKRGLTYGIYSYLANYDAADLWKGSVSSANDRIAEAIAVIRDEWERMRKDGVTEDELRDAKTYLTGAYPLRFDGNVPIARIAVGMQLDGLSPDYVKNRNDMVEAVTQEDVNRVARDLMNPSELTFVVVGRPVGLDATLN